MKVYFHGNFEKKYAKLKSGEKKKFKDRKAVFIQDPYNPVLNNHALKGRYRGYRSISIAGDLRVVYKLIRKDGVLFVTIDTHSNLYD